MQQLQNHADDARARAVDRDQLKAELDQANLEHAKAVVDLDDFRNDASRQTRALQDQVGRWICAALHQYARHLESRTCEYCIFC